MSRVPVFLLAACWALSMPIAQAVETRVPGSRVIIDVPRGFVSAKKFTGLEHPDGTAFIVTELPKDVLDEMRAKSALETLATRANILRAKPLALQRSDRYLAFEGEYEVPGYSKGSRFMLITADGKSTTLVMADTPRAPPGSRRVQRTDVLHALSSVTTANTAAPAAKRFSLGYLGPFRFAGNIIGAISMYNLDGKLAGDASKPIRAAPVLIVMLPMNDQVVDDVKSVAREMLLKAKGRTNVEIKEEKSAVLDGVKAIEQVALATDALTSEQIGVYSVIAAARGGGFIYLEGSAPIQEFKRLLPEFRKIAASFRRKDT